MRQPDMAFCFMPGVSHHQAGAGGCSGTPNGNIIPSISELTTTAPDFILKPRYSTGWFVILFQHWLRVKLSIVGLAPGNLRKILSAKSAS
jgi:hypothetical protein